ncbi:MAG: hypothetical protein GY862_10385 [Gammaproteobacteria bacterium]|nr:hypothetical protein [Gammaproteobacteria bacterium]
MTNVKKFMAAYLGYYVMNLKKFAYAICLSLTISVFSNMAYSETLNDALLRSGVVIGKVDIPNKLIPGNTYTIGWVAQAYIPIRSKISITYADRKIESVEGSLMITEDGDFSIKKSDPSSVKDKEIKSKKYFFEASITIPTGKNGDAKIGFHNALTDGDPMWMYSLFPSGVISRPYGTGGKQFKIMVGN